MRTTVFSVLTLSFVGSFGSCKTKFISPPNQSGNGLLDPEKCKRYAVGETVPLKWETDVDDILLVLLQRIENDGLKNFYHLQKFPLDATRTSWGAKYDQADEVKDGEDSLYLFAIFEPGTVDPVASSVYFNVTAPKDDIQTVTAPPSTVTISQNRHLDVERTSTATDITPEEATSTSEEQENNSTSGMSQGEVAGAAVGGIVGGLLIFGAIGWVLWRRMVKKKSQPDPTMLQYREHVVETKAELPGDNRVHPSEYATSPTGIYEAP